MNHGTATRGDFNSHRDNLATVTVNRNVDFGPSSQVQLLGHVTHNFCKDA